MNRNINTLTVTDKPSSRAALLAQQAAELKTDAEKRRLGQYFTPLELARLSAGSLPLGTGFTDGKIRILDPGAGTAVLSCVLIEELCTNCKINEIELTCYESDLETARYTAESLENLKNWLANRNIIFSFNLISSDFVYENIDLMKYYPVRSDLPAAAYDLIISNPPFFKLDSASPYLSNTNHEFRYHLNIYHLFLFISANLLASGGRMIFIIPSSFFSGGYFKVLRRPVLNILELENVKFIKSSGGIFETGSVLADTVIITLKNSRNENDRHSTGVTSLSGFPGGAAFNYSFCTGKDADIFPLFTSDYEKRLFEKLQSWPSSLSQAGYQVNEGNLLASEAGQYSFKRKSGRSIEADFIHKKKNLSPARDYSEKLIYDTETVALNEDFPSLQLPSRNLVIIRRYNSKDSVPIKCSPFLSARHKSQILVIDKRLLYLDRPSREMTDAETAGLTQYLNSNLLRKYIGITYGKINLTSGEYLNLPCPPEEIINRSGNYFLNHFMPERNS